MKLTDTQLVLLSAASQRDDRALERPANLPGGAAGRVVAKLLAEGLVEEVQPRGSLPVWRRDGDGAHALRITKKGLSAIQVEDEAVAGGADEPTKKPPAPSASRRGDTEQRADPVPDKPSRRPAARDKRSRGEALQQSADPKRRESKQGRVVEMLHRRQGATIAVIMKVTGWQPHSVRGFLTGVVRNKLGLKLVSEKNGGDRVYRVVAGNAAKGKRKSGRKAA